MSIEKEIGRSNL